jgi:Domain of unknown function (DUF1707)
MCHHRRQPRRFEAVPRRDPEVRASDSDREEIVTELRHHGAAGRLDVDELEERIESAYGARTYGDLQGLLADLPKRRVVPEPRPDWHGSHEWRVFFAVNALLIAIWAVSGAGYFWPVWVMAWWAFALLMRSAPGLLRPR